jgi:hypothetical protein
MAAKAGAVMASRRVSARVRKIFAISEAAMDALMPRDIFRMLAKAAMLRNDEKMLLAVARDWGPYEHAKKTDAPPLTPDEVRYLGEIARAEANRRRIDITRFNRDADGAMPN